MVKLVFVNGNFCNDSMTLEDEPSLAVKETLDRVICSLSQEKYEYDLNEVRSKLFTKNKKLSPP